MSRKTFIAVLAAAGLAAAAYWLAFSPGEGSGPRIGAAAPEHRWTDLSGQSVDLSQYRGRVVLLDFWATWCESCREELPALQKLYGDYHPLGLELLALSVDEDGRKALIPYLAGHSIPWKVLLSDSEDVAAYGVYGLPTAFLIDPQGVILQKYVGSIDPETLESDVRAALKKETPAEEQKSAR